MLQAVAQGVMLQWGWRRALLAMLAGAASVLAMPPLGAAPILFVTLPVLVWLIDGAVASGHRARLRTLLSAAAIGWCFGFGYFLAGLWWIGGAFLVDAERYAWLLPFAIMLMPAGLALFFAAAAVLARLMWRPGPLRIFVFAASFAAFEILRGYALTGFPWNAFGYALASTTLTAQVAAVIGLHGMTALALFVFAAPAALGLSDPAHRYGRISVLVLALGITALVGGYGAYRLSLPEPAPHDVRLRIVQPSIPQAEKWDPEKASQVLAAQMTLSDIATAPDASGIADFDAVIWPESAFPFFLQDEPTAIAALTALIPQGTVLISGLQRYEPTSQVPRGYHAYNALAVIGDNGQIQSTYNKTHLVPFGEYLPLQPFMEAIGFRQLTGLPGGFDAGAERAPLSAPGVPPFLPLICYEAIFPGVMARDLPRPAWLLNVTNDAWYGDTPGPRQHLMQASLRAIEEGLPLVRAANNGISAVVDSRGRTLTYLPLDARSVIDVTLPGAMPPPPFTRFGLFPALAIVGAFFALGLFRRGRVATIPPP